MGRWCAGWGKPVAPCPLSSLVGPGQTLPPIVGLTPGVTRVLSKEFVAHEFASLESAEMWAMETNRVLSPSSVPYKQEALARVPTCKLDVIPLPIRAVVMPDAWRVPLGGGSSHGTNTGRQASTSAPLEHRGQRSLPPAVPTSFLTPLPPCSALPATGLS